MTPILGILLFHGAAAVAIKIAAAIALFGGLGTFITVQTPGPMVPTNSPDYDTVVGQSSNLPFQFEVLTGTTDVITGGAGVLGNGAVPPICGTSFLETAGVDACTLAAPVAGAPAAGGNDGLEITIIDNGGHAHTVTAPANAITPAHHLLTFNGTQGSFVTLIARNGKWLPVQQSGVAIS
jgi:hypothetical protein